MLGLLAWVYIIFCFVLGWNGHKLSRYFPDDVKTAGSFVGLYFDAFLVSAAVFSLSCLVGFVFIKDQYVGFAALLITSFLAHLLVGLGLADKEGTSGHWGIKFLIGAAWAPIHLLVGMPLVRFIFQRLFA